MLDLSSPNQRQGNYIGDWSANASEKPGCHHCKYLKQFPSYLKFIGAVQSDASSTNEIDNDDIEVEATLTPLELIESSFESLHKATSEELLTKLKTCSPSFFERVVVLLLRAMGYGGVTGDGSVTGKSGDGGIDGIIREGQVRAGCRLHSGQSDTLTQPLEDRSYSSLLEAWTLFKPIRA